MISNRQKQIDWLEEEINWSRERQQIEYEEEQEYQKLKAELNKEKIYINRRIVKQPRIVSQYKNNYHVIKSGRSSNRNTIPKNTVSRWTTRH